MTKEFIAEEMRALQLRITEKLEEIDGNIRFRDDAWERADGGGGNTRTVKDGNIIEKGGVAYSAVHGSVTEAMKKQLNLDGNEFFATGVSIVLHPKSPMIPIIHMNVRYFQLDNGTYWFGGGIDLTPHYVVDENAKIFHSNLKEICDKYHPEFYARFKPWADDYFFIPHREETRGIGGIFFDHQDEKSGIPKDELFKFCIELGDNFSSIYQRQLNLGKDLPVSEQNIQWRNIRRGRYVEFNLVHDRGTKFGLFSGGRTESILMSLPPLANWEYDFQVEKNSEEEKTQTKLVKGIHWIF